MSKKLAEMTEEELNLHYRKMKIKEDAKALRKFVDRQRKTMKNYSKKFECKARNQRKSREYALGVCALQALDDVRQLMRTKNLEPKTLEFMISEAPYDDNGEKVFHCSVMYCVTSYERAYTDEEIQKDVEETFEKMMRETDKLYPAEGQHEEKESVQDSERDPEGDH